MLKIGGIYTSDSIIKGKRAAIIIIDKHPFCVSYYELPILSYYTRDDIEMILKDQIQFKTYYLNTIYHKSENFLTNDLDGYIGQINQEILDFFIKKFIKE